MFEYAKGRFVNPSKISNCSIYTKQGDTPDEQGNYPITHRVAIDLDVKDATKATVYSDAYTNDSEARRFVGTIPISED